MIVSKQVTGGVGEHLCEGQFYLTRSQALVLGQVGINRGYHFSE